jgi:hypothetical protein
MFDVRIKPGSRGDDIYEVEEVENGQVALLDWTGGYEFMWVRKRPGMEREEVVVEGPPVSDAGAEVVEVEVGVDAVAKVEVEPEVEAEVEAEVEVEIAEQPAPSLFGRLSSFFKSPPSAPSPALSPAIPAPVDPKETIHVYSVATGALYEARAKRAQKEEVIARARPLLKLERSERK